MSYTFEQLISYAAVSFIIGMLIAYIIVRAIRVSRSSFDELKETLGATKNELDTQKAMVSKAIEDKNQLEIKLNNEQHINRSQEQKISSLSARYESILENYKNEKSINEVQQTEINNHRSQITGLTKDIATYTANNRALLERLDEQKKEIIAIRKESELQFEKIANRLLEEKSERFSKSNRESIQQILQPLQEKIRGFEQKVESTNKESIARHSGLKEMISNLQEQTNKVSSDANNLAKALKGDFKQQGNWGELVLQSILDRSGLVKGEEYEIQVSERNIEGKLYKPDVVIKLPDNKRLIIDSKVSLVAYDQLIAAIDQEEAMQHAKNHSIAVKNHVNTLASKNYHDLYQVESPDFVLMFIPIDTAFSAAIKEDTSLYEYAFSKNIIIVTASTLLATLKTVESLWKNDKQNRNALEIAAEAGKMYDKFVGFIDDMEKMGNQLNTVQNTYSASMKKLSEGSGNLLRRAEKIKSLGANANKSLPQKVSL